MNPICAHVSDCWHNTISLGVIITPNRASVPAVCILARNCVAGRDHLASRNVSKLQSDVTKGCLFVCHYNALSYCCIHNSAADIHRFLAQGVLPFVR